MAEIDRISDEDVGKRVVVRRWMDDPDGGEEAVKGDVLGYLEKWSEDGILTVRTRDDEAVHVAVDDVVAAKTIPPPPASRA